MENPVFTIKGVLPRSELEVQDIIEEGPGWRTIATEWRLKSSGELVRRDAWASMFITQTLAGQLPNSQENQGNG